MRTAYLTDFCDSEWSCLEPHLLKITGSPRFDNTREILNAIFYILKNGCA
jgi:putative transposase